MKLYGTKTSPFVRRVRIVAAELGVPIELVDTTSDDGQKALRAVSPLWKVPVVELDGRVIFDSRIIIDHLLDEHGYGSLRPVSTEPSGWVCEQNLVSAIDTALESAVVVYYFDREGAELDRSPYLVKQRDRIESILGWIDSQLDGPWVTSEAQIGLSEIALVTALDWFVFRERYPVDSHPNLAAFRAAHAGHPSLRSTYPVLS
ncbi:MAG TPA: glutathione S-transferase family protein [Kofleriaceae bacterium]|nr:glutathione S-transferase family protein [Kofleriaceae bacterium]